MKKILLLCALPLLAWALTIDEIVQRVDVRDDGDHSVSTMQMVLIDKNGQQRVREMKSFKKDVGNDIHSLIFFMQPSDVKNTAFLTYDYDDSSKDDDQWLYLPALKKSKRIAGSDKSGSFMGSDFTYSDMTKREIRDYNYKLLQESDVRGEKTWVIESVPKLQKTIDETGYTKSIMFVRQDNFVVVRALHFLNEGNKRKYMDVKKLEHIDGIWVATQIEMKTVQGKETLHTTLLNFGDMRFGVKQKEDFFTVPQIEKGL